MQPNLNSIFIIITTLFLFIDSIFSIFYITKQTGDNSDVKKTAIAFNSITLSLSIIIFIGYIYLLNKSDKSVDINNLFS